MLSKLRASEDTGDTLFPRADTDLDISLVLMGSGRKVPVTDIENVF